jgi:hypothetical protein
MNKQEFAIAIDMIESIHHDLFERKNYDYTGKAGIALHKEHRTTTLRTWFALFESHDVSDLVRAITVYMSKSRFIPKPADLLAIMKPVNKTHQLTASEGWDEAYKALGSFGRNRAEDGLASLSPVVRRVVKGFGWANLCNQEIDSFFMSKWAKQYEECRFQEIEADERDPGRADRYKMIEQTEKEIKQIAGQKPTPQKDMTAETESFRRTLEETMERTGLSEAEVMRELKSKIGVQHCQAIQEMLKGCIGASERPKGYWKGK